MAENDNTAAGRVRVLLVDDAPEVLHALARILALDYDVTSAASAAEALEILAKGPEFAVVVSDQNMPGMSGLELLERVAEEHSAASRIMLTGLPDLDLAVGALHQSRIHRFLSKPCRMEELREAVRSGVELFESRSRELLRAGELEFTTDSLAELNRSLEERVTFQDHSLDCLRMFAVELNTLEDSSGIARAAARVTSEVLGGRGVYVQIWDEEEISVECSVGPEMSARMISEPLTTRDGIVGEIVVDAMDAMGQELSKLSQNLLAAIASSAAVAVHNEFRRRERDEAQYATVFALARLSEQRDNETGKHLERVSSYCRLIAEALRKKGLHLEVITDAYIFDLERSAPLHDIGKVGIPDSILLKPGKLTSNEWEIMKTHSEIGADTLRSVIVHNNSQSYLTMGLDIAWAHHERWDGSGYPRGLAGPAIPLAARILALADVYDALTSVRPYKAAWEHEKAMSFLEEGRGKHFDPDVVDAFCDLSEQVEVIRERLADRLAELESKLQVEQLRKSA